MSSTIFVNQTTVVEAAWLNDVNNVTYVTVPGLNTTVSALNTSKANAGANTDIISLGNITSITSNVTVPTQANGTANGTAASTLFVSNAVTNAPQSTQLQSIDYTLSGNALTLKLNPTTLAFRSTTLTNGAPTLVSNAAQITTTISSGSTGGTTSAVQSDIVLLAINNAGAMELAWTNLAGGTNLDETTLINTTAEGGAGAADSATVIYSTTARTGVAFRIVGIFRSTQTTAGTWAQSPTLVQGVGGLVRAGSDVYSGVAVATTSGTAIDFTGIPSWVKRITLVLDQVSTNGTAVMRVQLGSGSVQTTGYSSTGHYLTGGTGGGSSGNGFDSFGDGVATVFRTGLYTFCKLSGNLWVMSGVNKSGASQSQLVSGSVDLSGALDRLRVTTGNGTDVFDNGSVNILWE